MERRLRETDSAWVREEFERYQNNRPCGAAGLSPEARALAVKIAGNHVGEVVQLSIQEALDWITDAPNHLSSRRPRSPPRSSRRSASGWDSWSMWA